MAEDYNIPEDLRYTKNHEWIRLEGQVGVIGITDFAQEQLGDITYVEFELDEGEEVAKEEIFATVEAVKAAEPCYLPASGRVIELNFELEDEPELVNEDPYGEGWILKIDITDKGEIDGLLDAKGYEAILD